VVLHAAREEAEAIVAIVGDVVAPAGRVLIGPAAGRRAVGRLSSVDGYVLHLACHATAHPEDPELSAIQLTPAAAESLDDAVWRAHEIAEHRTGHRVVVLSACETGVGPVSAEGVLALSRAFLNAGATSVVASLWEVFDDATATLMPALHERLAAGHSPRVALREMQLSALDGRATAHPSSWAAFCVTGAA
jgi:CHAT domain-containing protein